MLPALNKAREKARASTCVSNLKQSFIPLMAYSDSFSGFWPRATAPNSTWGKLLHDSGYVNNYSALMCPSYAPNKVKPGLYAEDHADYWMWSSLTYGMAGVYDFALKAMNVKDCVEPGRSIFLMDSASRMFYGYVAKGFTSTEWNQSHVVYMTGKDPNYRIHLRHSKRANILYMDGHVTPGGPKTEMLRLYYTKGVYAAIDSIYTFEDAH